MKKKFIVLLFLIFLLSISSFLIWGNNPQSALPEALDGLQSTSSVKVVKKSNQIVFIPVNFEARTGIIFYPGGHVEPEAYAPLLRNIAESGYFIIVIRMPLNLAILGIDQANKYIEEYSQIDTWIIAGHSLGGAMAAIYTDRNPTKVDGLILWASYPSNKTNLNDSPLSVLSIYASNDGLSTLSEIKNSSHLLPDNTVYVEISGGNHSQFGYYGFQNGDLNAGISIQEQQEIILYETTKFLDQFSKE